MKKITYFFVFIVLFSFSSCRKEKQEAPLNCTETTATLTDKTGLDGCQWMLLLSDNSLLEPINLMDFDIELEEGKAVCVRYEEASVGSICMAGTTIKILSIQ